MGRHILILGVVGAVGGCLGGGIGDPEARVAGAVEGSITDEGGMPVASPAVSLSLLTQPVNGQSRVLSSATLVANGFGQFVVTFVVDNEEPQDAILAITATPPPGLGLRQNDSIGLPVRLSDQFPPADTSFIQLELPVRPAAPR